MAKPKFDPSQPFESSKSKKPKFDPSQPFESPEVEPKTSALSAITKGAQQALFGFGEEAQAGLEKGLENLFGGGAVPLDYDTRVTELRGELAQAREDRPGLTYGAEILSGLALPIPGAGFAAKGATTGAKALRAAGYGAGTAGLSALGASEAEDGLGTAGDVTKGVIYGGALGGALPGIGAGVSKLYNAAPKILAKVRKIPESIVRRYGTDEGRKAIDAIAQSSDEIPEAIIDASRRQADEINAAKEAFVSAQLQKEARGLEEATRKGFFVNADEITGTLDGISRDVVPVGPSFVRAKETLSDINEQIRDLARKNAAGFSANTGSLNEQQKRAVLNLVGGLEYSPARLASESAEQFRGTSALGPRVPQKPVAGTDPTLGYSFSPDGRVELNPERFDATIPAQQIIKNQLEADLLPVEKIVGKEVLTPRQVVDIRRNLDSEAQATFTSEAGKQLPGKDQISSLADSLRATTSRISSEAAEANQALSRGLKVSEALKNYGLTQKTIENSDLVIPEKLSNLFSVGEKNYAKTMQKLGAFDSVYGTRLGQEFDDVYGARMLNPQGILDKLYTGGGAVPAAVATSAGIPWAAAPYFALQAPIGTKALIRGGVAIDKRVQYLQSQLQKLPEQLRQRIGTGVLKQLGGLAATGMTPEMRDELLKSLREEQDMSSVEKAKLIQELQRAQ
jgi:hypothetical protein